MNNGNFPRASKLSISVLKDPKIYPQEKALIFNLLTSIVTWFGYKKYLKAADVWSKKAMKLVDNQETKIHRGAILVEIKNYAVGKEMLLPFTAPDNKPKIIAFCSCYIAKAEYFMGDEDMGIKWLLKAKKIGVVNHLVEQIGADINYII